MYKQYTEKYFYIADKFSLIRILKVSEQKLYH